MSDDLGYFGPDSVTWRLHGEPLSMVGGLRALLLQALHPDAMAVMDARSSFRQQPWQRLRSTVIYVSTITFGTTEQADAAAARVREVHARLGITDAEQLAWVHACEVDSFLAAGRVLGVVGDSADADRYVVEQARAAALVGIPDALVPGDAAQLAAFIASLRPRLRATPSALEAAHYVLATPLPVAGRWAAPARVGWSALAALAVGLLPDWARRAYGIPPLPGAGLATTAALRAARPAVALLPARWRESPPYQSAQRRAARAAVGAPA